MGVNDEKLLSAKMLALQLDIKPSCLQVASNQRPVWNLVRIIYFEIHCFKAFILSTLSRRNLFDELATFQKLIYFQDMFGPNHARSSAVRRIWKHNNLSFVMTHV